MIALSVSEISALGGFCDEQYEEYSSSWMLCKLHTVYNIIYSVALHVYCIRRVILHSKVPIFRLQSEEKKNYTGLWCLWMLKVSQQRMGQALGSHNQSSGIFEYNIRQQNPKCNNQEPFNCVKLLCIIKLERQL